jgi:hypothetical protein
MATHTTTTRIRSVGRLVLALMVLGSVACKSAGNVRAAETAVELNESGGENSSALDDIATRDGLLGQLHHQDEGSGPPERPAIFATYTDDSAQSE